MKKHESSFATFDADVREWLPNIREHLADIDADSNVSRDDKKLLKQFYLQNCLPPFIHDVVRKYFPDEFLANDRPARSTKRAKSSDHNTSPQSNIDGRAQSYIDGRSHSYTESGSSGNLISGHETESGSAAASDDDNQADNQ